MEERSNLKKKSRIQQNHERVINLPEMQHSFLDSFNLENFNLPKVSVIIPTYNRCPHTLEEDANPLGWCLESLLTQRGGNLDEIIIVDDASSDYTKDVVNYFSDLSKKIFISYIQNNEKKGMCRSRNVGISRAMNNLLLFLDDDCVFSRYMLFGANYTFNNLGENTVALHPPIYQRKTIPEFVSVIDIGILDLDKGIITGNYNGFPIEYTSDIEKNFMDNDLKILKPVEIKNLAGVFLVKKEALEEVNGFPENFPWENEYGAETELALNFSKNGWQMFLTPDPKFYCVHLKYGVNGNNKCREDLMISQRLNLKHLIRKSDFTMNNTGGRTNKTEEWFYNTLLSSFFIIGKRNFNGARNLANRFYNDFVLKNNLSLSGLDIKINDFSRRYQIWKDAVLEGERLVNQFKDNKLIEYKISPFENFIIGGELTV